jgi:hypothetical protein
MLVACGAGFLRAFLLGLQSLIDALPFFEET